MSGPDPFAHHVAAQDAGGAWSRAMAEVSAGRKTSHWMWFVFPQLAGLGHSEMARRYAIADLGEARFYLGHPILGERLRRITGAVVAGEEQDPVRLFGPVDAVKLRSCWTLFEAAAAPGEGSVFADGLERLFAGARCPLTSARLGRNGPTERH